MPSRALPAVLAAISLLAASAFSTATAAAADPAPLGPPRLVGEAAPADEAPPCGRPGAPVELRTVYTPPTDPRAERGTEEVRLVRRESDGTETLLATLVSTASGTASRLACRTGGSGVAMVAVGWGPYPRWVLQEFTADGALPTPLRSVTAQPYCEYSSGEWMLEPGGDLVSLAACYDPVDWPYRVGIRRIPASATEEPEPLWLRGFTQDRIGGLTAARDGLGHSLFVWDEVQEVGGRYPKDGRLFAAATGPDGKLLGDVLRVDTFDPGLPGASGIRAEADGLFTVYWNDRAEGGALARIISVDPDLFSSPTTTTTTLPASPDAPAFAPSRSVGHTRGDATTGAITDAITDDSLLSLTADGFGGLMLRRWRRGDYWGFEFPNRVARNSLYLSPDAGLRWSDAHESPPTQRWFEATTWDGASRDGTWIATNIATEVVRDELQGYEYRQRVLSSRRSTDGGQTWTDPAMVDTVYCGDCDEFHFVEMSLAAARNGRWMVSSMSINDDRPLINTRWSTDDGRSWEGGQTLRGDRAECDPGWCDESEAGSHLATTASPSGAWGLALRSMGTGSLRVARTEDAALPWEVVEIVPPVTRPPDIDRGDWWDPARPYGRPSLVVTPKGTWILAWEDKRPAAEFGADSEIAFVRSTDDGRTWSEPRPLGAYARLDGASDREPSLAVDGDGRVLAVWASNDPLGGAKGTDADIVQSISTDDGNTWSPPLPVEVSAGTDDREPRAVGDSSGRWTVAWTSNPIPSLWDWHWSRPDVRVAVAGSTCGDGVVESGEDCDDANAVDGDGCNANCTLPGCGNEVVETGEACDGITGDEWESCTATCELPLCGDGERDVWTERCDDGNGLDTDECPGTCTWANCGDGFVRGGVEECDDANTVNDDACTNLCERAKCGDGVVQAVVGETCEDGDAWGGNACTDQCVPARCGDGRTWFGMEECDDPDGSRFAGACSADCRFTGPCSDADASGLVTATDALLILRAAVGLEDSCESQRCDVDGSGQISAVDAYLALRRAAGLQVALRCADDTGWALFQLETSSRIGALLFNVDAGAHGLDFRGKDGKADCDLLLDDAMVATNVDESGRLTVGLISMGGFLGPVPLLKCRYVPAGDGASEGPLLLQLVEATTIDGESLLEDRHPPVVTMTTY